MDGKERFEQMSCEEKQEVIEEHISMGMLQEVVIPDGYVAIVKLEEDKEGKFKEVEERRKRGEPIMGFMRDGVSYVIDVPWEAFATED